jgi:hypothetical protein
MWIFGYFVYMDCKLLVFEGLAFAIFLLLIEKMLKVFEIKISQALAIDIW